MVAAGVGITLLPTLAVQPPVPNSPDIRLLRFSGTPPHRQIGMLWRRSSAMSEFLMQLADELRKLPAALLQPPGSGAESKRKPASGAR